MDSIVWDASFSVGVDELDDQHKQLINMINQLKDIKNISVGSESISTTLAEMTKYMDYHFKAEEKYLIDSGYPDFLSHSKQHNEFMEKTMEFCQDTIDRKEDVPEKIHSYLMLWLTNHILKSDMKYKSHLSEQGFK